MKIRRTHTFFVLLLFTFILESCTVAYYKVRNELEPNISKADGMACARKFSVSVLAVPRQLTRVPQYHLERFRKERLEFIHTAEETLSKNGCSVIFVEEEDEANFKIRVTISPLWSALPQEWLTGLSFGLLPSWGTRPSEFTFEFEDTETKAKHAYIVDQKSYNHLILFPFFWITFLTLDQTDVFEESLTNFIESSWPALK